MQEGARKGEDSLIFNRSICMDLGYIRDKLRQYRKNNNNKKKTPLMATTEKNCIFINEGKMSAGR